MSMDNPNYAIWKEPRGFLKCLEVFLAIFAFSCTTGYRGKVSFHQDYNSSSHLVSAEFKYPFNDPLQLKLMRNVTEEVDQTIGLSQRSSTEFFVVIGVFCFLFSLAMLIYYVLFEDVNAKAAAKQASGSVQWLSGSVIDFVFSVFWAFFWFVASIAEAAAVSKIKDATDVNAIMGALPLCQDPYKCRVDSAAKYATLTVSILLGFLNVFVWCGNAWFSWKETPWHKEPQKTIPVQVPQHQITPSAI